LLAIKEFSYFFVESILAFAESMAALAVSILAFEESIAALEESIALLEESVLLASVLAELLQAAKTPIDNTNKSFFIVIRFCVE